MAEDLKSTTAQDYDGGIKQPAADHEVRYWAEWCLPLGTRHDVQAVPPIREERVATS